MELRIRTRYPEQRWQAGGRGSLGRASFWRRFSSCSFLFSFPSKVCQSSSEVNRFIPTRIIGGEIRKEVKYKFRPRSAFSSSPFGVSTVRLSNRQMFLHKHEKKEGDSILRLGVQCGYDGCNTGNAILMGPLGHTGQCGPLDPLLN